jgi:hypothetical protein
MSTAIQSEPLLTAEEFAEHPDTGYPEELVRGRIVPLPISKPRHGQICASYEEDLPHPAHSVTLISLEGSLEVRPHLLKVLDSIGHDGRVATLIQMEADRPCH